MYEDGTNASISNQFAGGGIFFGARIGIRLSLGYRQAAGYSLYC
jgi:hypothetical protein